ncbi:ATP-grasp domain-containing protein [bacterium]|nr:ATP-grasp domain-containing protein [bacterium]
MQPHLAETNSSKPPKVLVLGSPGESDWIAQSLEKQGVQSVLRHRIVSSGGILPSGADSNALLVLKRIFQEFLLGCEGFTPWLHPGTTNWADRHEMVMLAELMGINPISPPARVLSLFDNRLALLDRGEKLSIPHLALSFEPVHSIREVEELLQKTLHTGPVVLKSVRSGSGYDILVVHHVEELTQKLPLWLEQLAINLGSSMIFVEKYVAGARSVRVPFARFRSGKTEFFPVSDISLQTHSRKILELCQLPESESNLDVETLSSIRAWTEQLARDTGFVGVGSFEFLVDGSRAYLIGGSPRLNEGFRLWEEVAGTDAIAWQWATMSTETPPEAEYARLVGKKSRSKKKVGLLARLYSVDPLLELPQVGRIHEISEKTRWSGEDLDDSGAQAHLSWAVSRNNPEPSQTLNLGQIVVTAENRLQAMQAARKVLKDIWISGSLQTNERQVRDLLNHPWVEAGFFHANFLEEEFFLDVYPPEELTQSFAAVCDAFGPSFQNGNWLVGTRLVKRTDQALKWVEPPKVESDVLTGVFEQEFPEMKDAHARYRVCAYPMTPNGAAGTQNFWQVRIGQWFQKVRFVPDRPASESKTGVKSIRSLATGRVHAILFREDSWTPAHETVVVIESLGVLVPHSLPLDARIIKWGVKAEDTVYSGQELAEIELRRKG